MAITASKPAINIREKLSELDQPQGIKGTEVLRADTADEARNAVGARGRRNLLMNGRGLLDQRGFSGVSLNGGDYSLDRWYHSAVGTTSTQLSGGGFKVGRTSLNTYTSVIQKIEDCYNVIGTKSFTISFDIKWNTYSGSGNSMVYFRWLQDDSSTTETGTAVEAGNLSEVGRSGWEKFTATITMPDDAINPKHLRLQIYGSKETASAWEFELDNVQLELGSVSTDFEHRSYGEELALCQRYYQTGRMLTNGTGHQYTSHSQAFTTTMCGVPTFVTKDLAGNTGKVSGDVTNNIPATIGGDTRYVRLNIDNTTVGANVFIHSEWTADAEL